MFSRHETNYLRRAIHEDFRRGERDGSTMALVDWNVADDSLFGMVARCERLVRSVELLLEGEAYHYYSRVVFKDAHVGDAFPWHQDYAYWYYYGVLQPLLVSAFVAIDPATRHNGCLQVIEGSQTCGRLDHSIADDRCADPVRVEALLRRMPVIDIEMESGDVLFFHCNLLHRSDANRSNMSRWSLICVYNAARNNPYLVSRHSCYAPLNRVPDGSVIQAALARFDDTIA
jgi:ectoine hydroxylase-related dioxygenase (phytanoyl-CoA dioxygenase family)